MSLRVQMETKRQGAGHSQGEDCLAREKWIPAREGLGLGLGTGDNQHHIARFSEAFLTLKYEAFIYLK